MRILILLSVLSLSYSSFAAEAIEHLDDTFSASICAELLKHERTSDFEVLARAEEVVSWVTLRHPTVRNLLARDSSSMDRFYDLLFLSTGFVVPPPRDSRFSSTEASKRYDAGARFEHSRWKKDLSRGRQALLSSFPQLGTNPRVGAKYEVTSALIANLVIRSATALRNLTNDWSRYGDKNDEYRPIRFQSDLSKMHLDLVTKSDWDAAFGILWGPTFSTSELDTLRETLKHLNDPRVRAVVVQRLADELPSIISESRELCGLWSKCTSVDEAKAILNLVKSMDEPVAVLAKDSSAQALVPARRPRLVAAEKPVPFESGAIQEFLRTHPQRHGAVDSVVVVMRELQGATDILIDSLFQLQSWRSHDVDWAAWLAELQPSKDSLLQLRQKMTSRQEKLTEALAELEKGMASLKELRGWTVGMNQYLNNADLKTHAPQLSNSDQSMLGTTLTMSTSLERLMSDAHLSIEMRQTLVTETINAIFGLQMMIAKVGESLVRDSSVLVQLDNQEAFASLRATLERLARPDQD